MAQVLVRNIDYTTMEALKSRARANRRSTQAEIREILDRAAREPDHERRSLMSLVGSVPSRRTTEEIVAEIRALRDEWDDRP